MQHRRLEVLPRVLHGRAQLSVRPVDRAGHLDDTPVQVEVAPPQLDENLPPTPATSVSFTDRRLGLVEEGPKRVSPRWQIDGQRQPG